LIRIRGGGGKCLSECDHNLYWAAGEDLNSLGDALTPNGTWAQWNEAGYDNNSVVADPLFVDPGNDDYRLQPDSPARKLGFKPIAMKRLGAEGFASGSATR